MKLRNLLSVAVLGFSVSAPMVMADDKIEVKDLPSAVTTAVKTKYPKAEVVGAEKETENGKTVFEVTVKLDGKQVELSLTEAGVIQSIEKTIEWKDLPAIVSAAIEAKYPKATHKRVEEVSSMKEEKENLDFYEVLLVTAENKTLEVKFLANGKEKEVEDKTAKKDKDSSNGNLLPIGA